MKRAISKSTGRRVFGLGPPITIAVLLLAALTASAGTNYTGTGWVTDIPVPPILCTNGSGQILFRASVHTVRVQTDEARTTGRRQVIVDGGYQADGSALIWGTVYQEVGTWDVTGTNFAATGGLWELNYRTVMQADNSLSFTLVGLGYGGTIDGLRLEETVTPTNTPYPIDTTVPYLYAGTMKPAPLNTSAVVDNFDDNRLTGWTLFLSPTSGGSGQLVETKQQFTVHGYWPGMITRSLWDTFALGYLSKSWSIGDGKTIEWRADLVGINENTTATKIEVGGYLFYKGRDYVALAKLGSGQDIAMFSCERAAIRNSNVVLAFAMTRAKQNLILTARVLDKTNQNAVLYERTVVDTPQADHSLTTAEFQAVTGMQLSLAVEESGGPSMSGTLIGLDIWQYNYDGQRPAAEATFDNLELRSSEVPGVGIERAVRLSWPASATLNYAVEGAPTLQGPWMPVQETTLPGMNQMTVPTSELMQFFRARQAP